MVKFNQAKECDVEEENTKCEDTERNTVNASEQRSAAVSAINGPSRFAWKLKIVRKDSKKLPSPDQRYVNVEDRSRRRRHFVGAESPPVLWFDGLRVLKLVYIRAYEKL